jgi:DNA-binding transcriptional regulator LsrR (DeoR family)
MKNTERNKIIHKILKSYYIDNMTQQEIALKLNISRVKVIRLMDYAKKEGMVEVKLNIPVKDSYELEDKIERKYQIRECSIVSTFNNENEIDRFAGFELSSILGRLLKKDTYLGISWSQTVLNVLEHLEFNKNIDINIVPIIGGLELDGFSTNSNIISHLFAEKIGGQAFSINIPAVLDSREAKEIIEKERHTIKMHELAEKIEVVITGVGNMDVQGTAFRSGYFTLSERNYLNSLGICGIMNLNFIDKDGNGIKTDIDDRIVKIFPLEKFRKCKNVIGVAFGEHKIIPLKAALKGRILDYLITDESTAKGLV